jgi:hemolysin activation/secretion protein
VPLGSRLTFAQRVVAQGVEGDAPISELSTVQSSYKQQEGLGGSSTIRGLPRNRYVGKALFLSNSELRWRVAEGVRRNKPVSLVLSTFLDAGRVWEDRFDLSTALSDLHAGYGGGARLGVGSSFVVALDVGHSSESAAAVYIGLGYLF